MTVTTWFNCPQCDSSIAVEVDIGEHLVDVDDTCSECGHRFTEAELHKIRTEAEQDAIGQLTDRATERQK